MAVIPIYEFGKERMPDLVSALRACSLELSPIGDVLIHEEGTSQVWKCADASGTLFLFETGEMSAANGLELKAGTFCIGGPGFHKTRSRGEIGAAFTKFENALFALGAKRLDRYADLDQCRELFRAKGVLAFCAHCGTVKKDYQSKCKVCRSNPRQSDQFLARSILMSTEQYYLRSAKWKSRTQETNRRVIEQDLLPQLHEKAELLRRRRDVSFDEEEYWIKRISREKRLRMPVSGIFFLVALYTPIILALVVVVYYFFFRKP